MVVHELSELIQRAQNQPKRKLAVAAAENEEVLTAVYNASKEEIIIPILVGNKYEIEDKAGKIGLDLSGIEVINNNGDESESARIAVSLVKSGKADILMKGHLKTGDLLKAVLDRDNGLRTSRLLSHVAFFQSPYYHKIFCVTDVAMNIAPDLDQKVDILRNAIKACHMIGIKKPKVAIAAAIEVINPRMEATVHAARLKEMNVMGRLEGCLIDGPFSVDIAFNKKAAVNKGIESEVAGDCDILLAPDIEAGNMFYKALNFLGGASTAAVVMGASAPIVLTSRADDDQTKLLSIALSTFIK